MIIIIMIMRQHNISSHSNSVTWERILSPGMFCLTGTQENRVEPLRRLWKIQKLRGCTFGMRENDELSCGRRVTAVRWQRISVRNVGSRQSIRGVRSVRRHKNGKFFKNYFCNMSVNDDQAILPYHPKCSRNRLLTITIKKTSARRHGFAGLWEKWKKNLNRFILRSTAWQRQRQYAQNVFYKNDCNASHSSWVSFPNQCRPKRRGARAPRLNVFSVFLKHQRHCKTFLCVFEWHSFEYFYEHFYVRPARLLIPVTSK